MAERARRTLWTDRTRGTTGAGRLGEVLVGGAVRGLATAAAQAIRRRGGPSGFGSWFGEMAAGAGLAAVQEIRSSMKVSERPKAVSAPIRSARRKNVTDPARASTRWRDRRSSAVRDLNLGAVALSFSILADSALEHYRGGFYNRIMYVGPAVAGLTLLSAAAAARKPARNRWREAVFAAATLTGLVGAGFHAHNVVKREGGVSWLNLFYAAPLGAPLGISFAGTFGLSASRLSAVARCKQPPAGMEYPSGNMIASAAVIGLLGTVAEAGLLHFRGAFQNAYMFLPVTVPPLSAAALAAALLHPTPARLLVARSMLRSTAALGLLGMGFHAYGIHRNMGGWRNWTQTILQGPPVPAPPAFTGMALASLAGIGLMEKGGAS
jgi:hypothetical protein